jgi:hypothetical protein
MLGTIMAEVEKEQPHSLAAVVEAKAVVAVPAQTRKRTTTTTTTPRSSTSGTRL